MKRSLTFSKYLILLGLFFGAHYPTLAQVPVPPPNMGSSQAGAQGTVAPPPNPWDPQGGWDVVYDGQTFTNELVIDNKTDVLVINCRIQDVNGSQSALTVLNSKRVLILNNVVSGHRYQGHGSGIRIGTDGAPCEYVIVENNTISDGDGNGISTGGASSSPVQKNPVPGLVIRDNLIHDVGKHHISDVHSPMHGMYVKATDPLVEGNVIYNCFDGSGLSIRSTGVYRNNRIWNVKGEGIAYWPQKDAGKSGKLIIENNVVYQDDNYSGPLDDRALLQLGLPYEKSVKFHDFTVRFNTLVAFGKARTNSSAMILRPATYNDIKAYGNVVVDLRPGVNRTVYIDGNESAGYFAYNYTATSDEGFANLAERDFRLTAQHPAVGLIPASANLPGYPPTDIEGRTRSYPLDAGAYALDTTPPPGEDPDDKGQTAAIAITAKGTCGGEHMRLNIDGEPVATWYNIGQDFTTKTYDTYTGGSIQVAFFNNGEDEAGCNRNLLVDYISVDGTRYQTEETATAHSQYPDCNTADQLRCDGYFDFGDLGKEVPPVTSQEGTIMIRAKSSQGTERMDLHVDGKPVKSWTVATAPDNYVYEGYGGGQIAVVFEDDGGQGPTDRNLAINYLIVCGTKYEDNAEGVSRTNCGADNRQGFTWLYCNGSLDFGNPGCSSNTNGTLATPGGAPTAGSESFRTYPNPTQGQLTVQGGADYQVTLCTMSGQVVMRHRHLRGTQPLDVRHLRPGVYLIKINDGPEQRQERIIVE